MHGKFLVCVESHVCMGIASYKESINQVYKASKQFFQGIIDPHPHYTALDDRASYHAVKDLHVFNNIAIFYRAVY